MWLHANQIQMEGVKIDFYDAHNRIVHETKRGKTIEKAHRAQVQYYLYKLWLHGIDDARGVLEYPDLRQTEQIPALTKVDIEQIREWERAILKITESDKCPPVVKKGFCKSCSYHDLCFIDEL
jgi:CRISPR-associated exonuclease Cas4